MYLKKIDRNILTQKHKRAFRFVFTAIAIITIFSFTPFHDLHAEDKAEGEEDLLHVICFSEDKNEHKNFIIDLENEKVIKPENMIWGRLNHSRLELWKNLNNIPEFFTFNRKSGAMKICKNDYISSSCSEYQCYTANPRF